MPGEGLCRVWISDQQAGPLPVLLYLPGADSRSPKNLTNKQRRLSFGADVAFYDKFIVIQPEASTSWKGQPFFWLLTMCEVIKQQRPNTELLLMGYSKGAWWGGLFLAIQPMLFHGAVLLAGYSSPMHIPEERAHEGSEVAMASAAKVSRVHAVCGARDTICPMQVYQSYFNAMEEGGVKVHTLAGVDHAGVYNRIALGATQDHLSVLSECRHALLPERTVQTIHV